MYRKDLKNKIGTFFCLFVLFSSVDKDMDFKSKVVDVSSFLLFEAIGDSEAGCFDPAMSAINHVEEDDDDNNDAESCSCNIFAPDFLPVGFRELNYSLEDKLANVDDDDDDDHEDEEDGEVVEQKEVHLYKKCRDDQRINGVVVAKEKKPSAVSVDSTETMNEMEKNRLFWEACLAS